MTTNLGGGELRPGGHVASVDGVAPGGEGGGEHGCVEKGNAFGEVGVGYGRVGRGAGEFGEGLRQGV